MKIRSFVAVCILAFIQSLFSQQPRAKIFPDGSEMPAWFFDSAKIKVTDLGNQFPITNFGAVQDSSVVQTEAIQKAIDFASNQGGGVVVIPRGTFLSGALFFKPKTHLHVEEGAVLKGSNNIGDYPLVSSRMEGQNLDYFPALVKTAQ